MWLLWTLFAARVAIGNSTSASPEVGQAVWNGLQLDATGAETDASSTTPGSTSVSQPPSGQTESLSSASSNVSTSAAGQTGTSTSSAASPAAAQASVSSCLSAYSVYSDGPLRSFIETRPFITSTILSSFDWTSTNTYYATEFYTLCDGHPRVNSSATASSVTSSSGVSTSITVIADPNYTTPPPPACTIDSSDCSSIRSVWSAWASTAGMATTPAPLTTPCVDCLQDCVIGASEAQVIYFALPANVSRDMCAAYPTGPVQQPEPQGWIQPVTTTMPDMTAGHKSAVENGTTYWDNSLYIKFTSLQAYGLCGNIGTVMTEALITLATSELSSIRKGIEVSYDLADLIPPVPFSAWDGLPMCQLGAMDPNCQTVIQDEFTPMVAVPGQVLGLQSGWSACTQVFVGIWDPPTALQAATIVDPPSTAAPATATPTPQPAVSPPPGPTSTPGLTPPAGTNQPDPQSISPGAPNDSDPTDPPGRGTPGATPPAQGVPSSASKVSGAQPGNADPPAPAPQGSIVSSGPSVAITLNSQDTVNVQPVAIATGADPGAPLVSAFVVGGTTLWSGGPAVTTDGQTISVGAGGVTVQGSGRTSVVAATGGLGSAPSDGVYTGAGSRGKSVAWGEGRGWGWCGMVAFLVFWGVN